MKVLLLLSILSPLFLAAKSYKILAFFPIPVHSQNVLATKIVDGLAKRGHNVTFVTSYPRPIAFSNITQISTQSLDVLIKNENKYTFDEQTFLGRVSSLTNAGVVGCRKYLGHKNVQRLLQSNETFDVVLIPEASHYALLGIGHRFQAPVIFFSPTPILPWSSFTFADPGLPSYVPNILNGRLEVTSFWARFYNTLCYIYCAVYNEFINIPKHRDILKTYLPKSPSLDELLKTYSLVLINSHVSTFEALPLQPNMIEIGGFHVAEPKPLPPSYQKFMDDSKNGVILFSMGSNFKSTNWPQYKLEALLKAFGKLKQNVLMKWETDSMINLPKNVKMVKWFPQNDILAHKNVKVFITSGGMLSTTESVYHAVPVIGIPFQYDENMNMELAAYNQYGIHIPFYQFTEERITKALNQILKDPIYKESAIFRSEILKDQPLPPLESALYWIEYVVRHEGAFHLRYAGADLTWYQRQLLDVLLFVITCISLFIYCCVVVVCKLRSCIRRNQVQSTKELEKKEK